MKLAEAFPDGRFEAPATEAGIAAAEAELGVRFPPRLRELYSETNGFREPLGNAQYLFSLDELVSGSEFLWETLPDSLPDVPFPDLKPFVFFGQDGIGGWWGMRIAPPHDIIYWHHHLLDREPGYEPQPGDVIDVLQAALALYEVSEND